LGSDAESVQLRFGVALPHSHRDAAQPSEALAGMSTHTPIRPSWTCRSCGHPWPCIAANAELTAAHSQVGDQDALARHLAWLAIQAAADLGIPSPAALYHRFVGWTLHPDRACRVCGKPNHDVIPGLPPRLFPCGGMPLRP
jgi:hypothetical protein